MVRVYPRLVIKELEAHESDHSKRHYMATRRLWNRERHPTGGDSLTDIAWRAGTFIYLNRTCFNGLWRVNRKGEFNVTPGKYKRPRICDRAGIVAASVALGHADLFYRDFRATAAYAEKGDFAYFDPPYDPISKTASFRSYTAAGFTDYHQRELADVALAMVGRGVKVMLSNSDTPFVRSLYKDKRWKVERVYAPRAINSDPRRRGKVAEVIITGGYRRHW
jgi:DNA adenine methylase